MDNQSADVDLLERYVAAFERLDDLYSSNVPQQLRVSTDLQGWHHWKVLRATVNSDLLQGLYRQLRLPGRGSTRLPPLYEMLVLSYRWAEVELGAYCLLANWPADDLSPLASSLMADENLRETLVPNGYIQFATGPGGDYDPVCFDFRHRQQNEDCRVVKISHEEILCNYRIRETAELAPNFRSLVLATIQRAASMAERPADG